MKKKKSKILLTTNKKKKEKTDKNVINIFMISIPFNPVLFSLEE